MDAAPRLIKVADIILLELELVYDPGLRYRGCGLVIVRRRWFGREVVAHAEQQARPCGVRAPLKRVDAVLHRGELLRVAAVAEDTERSSGVRQPKEGGGLPHSASAQTCVVSGASLPGSAREERNVSIEPSGDQRGEPALVPFAVIRTGAVLPSPSVDAIHSAVSLLSATRSVVVTV